MAIRLIDTKPTVQPKGTQVTKSLRSIVLTIVAVIAFGAFLTIVFQYAESRNATDRANQATSEAQCDFAQLNAGETPSDAIARTTMEMRDRGLFGPASEVLVDLDNADQAGAQWLSNKNNPHGLQPGDLSRFCATNLHVTEVGTVQLR